MSNRYKHGEIQADGSEKVTVVVGRDPLKQSLTITIRAGADEVERRDLIDKAFDSATMVYHQIRQTIEVGKAVKKKLRKANKEEFEKHTQARIKLINSDTVEARRIARTVVIAMDNAITIPMLQQKVSDFKIIASCATEIALGRLQIEPPQPAVVDQHATAGMLDQHDLPPSLLSPIPRLSEIHATFPDDYTVDGLIKLLLNIAKTNPLDDETRAFINSWVEHFAKDYIAHDAVLWMHINIVGDCGGDRDAFPCAFAFSEDDKSAPIVFYYHSVEHLTFIWCMLIIWCHYHCIQFPGQHAPTVVEPDD